jgi:hypothetical protein
MVGMTGMTGMTDTKTIGMMMTKENVVYHYALVATMKTVAQVVE